MKSFYPVEETWTVFTKIWKMYDLCPITNYCGVYVTQWFVLFLNNLLTETAGAWNLLRSVLVPSTIKDVRKPLFKLSRGKRFTATDSVSPLDFYISHFIFRSWTYSFYRLVSKSSRATHEPFSNSWRTLIELFASPLDTTWKQSCQ